MTEVRTSSAANTAGGSRVVYSLFVAVMVAFGLYAVFISGPALRAMAQEQLDRTIAEENRAFCEKFGMGTTTSKFVLCSQELATIRQKQADRDSAAAAGIL